MKILILLSLLALTACGTDDESDGTHSLARSYGANITDENPSGTFGEPGCEMTITKAEIDAASDSINAGGQVLPYAYDTVDGPFYVLIEATGTKSVQVYDKLGYAYAGVVCK